MFNNFTYRVSNRGKKEKGFTLIELMVVMFIIAILAIASVLVYTNQTERARQSTDAQNISGLEAAADNYQVDRGFTYSDYTTIDANHDLVKAGFVKTAPQNPWAATSKAQAAYNYILVAYKPSVDQPAATSAGKSNIENKVFLGKITTSGTNQILTYYDPATDTANNTITLTAGITDDATFATKLTGAASSQYFAK